MPLPSSCSHEAPASSNPRPEKFQKTDKTPQKSGNKGGGKTGGNPKIQIPDGCTTHNDDNRPLCFAFQNNKRKFKGPPGKRCARGYHKCYKKGCYRPKPYATCSRSDFFLLAGQLVSVTWSCKFIIGRWEVKICTRFSNWGEALCASETCETSWCMIEKAISGSWLNSDSEKPGQGPPGTQAPPGQVPGDTAREKTPNNNMIQSFNSKTIYIQLSRAVTRCSETHKIKISTEKMQVWNTSPVLSLKREHGLPRMTPGLPFTDTYLQYSSWKRQLQDNESMAA